MLSVISLTFQNAGTEDTEVLEDCLVLITPLHTHTHTHPPSMAQNHNDQRKKSGLCGRVYTQVVFLIISQPGVL